MVYTWYIQWCLHKQWIFYVYTMHIHDIYMDIQCISCTYAPQGGWCCSGGQILFHWLHQQWHLFPLLQTFGIPGEVDAQGAPGTENSRGVACQTGKTQTNHPRPQSSMQIKFPIISGKWCLTGKTYKPILLDLSHPCRLSFLSSLQIKFHPCILSVKSLTWIWQMVQVRLFQRIEAQ